MLGMSSWMHWVIVLAVAAVLFGGRGKISGLMGDFAKGIKAFKQGMKEDDAETAAPPPAAQVPPPVATPPHATAQGAPGATTRPFERA